MSGEEFIGRVILYRLQRLKPFEPFSLADFSLSQEGDPLCSAKVNMQRAFLARGLQPFSARGSFVSSKG